MSFQREFFDAGLIFIAVVGLLNALLTVWRVERPYRLRRLPFAEGIQLIVIMAAAATTAHAFSDQQEAAISICIAALVITAGIRNWLPRLTMTGAIDMALTPLSIIVAIPWSYCFLRDSGFPEWSMTIWKFFVVLGAIGLGVSFAS